jgi:hypothetical protein
MSGSAAALGTSDAPRERSRGLRPRLAIAAAGLVLVSAASAPAWLPLDGPRERVDELRLDYVRFACSREPHELRFRLPEHALAATELALWIDARYLDGEVVLETRPAALRERREPGRVVLEFPVAAAQESGEVVLRLRPRAPGTVTARPGLVGGPELEFTQHLRP